LIILSYIPNYEKKNNRVSIDSKMHLFLQSSNIDYQNLPCYHIIDETVDEVNMPNLYKSVDAFVLPTRGEGFFIC
jgi:hypothetical protein